eukprot:3682186-Prymnesium_polylepis.1
MEARLNVECEILVPCTRAGSQRCASPPCCAASRARGVAPCVRLAHRAMTSAYKNWREKLDKTIQNDQLQGVQAVGTRPA